MSSNHHAARAALIALATASIATLAGCGKDPKQGCDGLAAAASAAVAAGSVARLPSDAAGARFALDAGHAEVLLDAE